MSTNACTRLKTQLPSRLATSVLFFGSVYSILTAIPSVNNKLNEAYQHPSLGFPLILSLEVFPSVLLALGLTIFLPPHQPQEENKAIFKSENRYKPYADSVFALSTMAISTGLNAAAIAFQSSGLQQAQTILKSSLYLCYWLTLLITRASFKKCKRPTSSKQTPFAQAPVKSYGENTPNKKNNERPDEIGVGWRGNRQPTSRTSVIYASSVTLLYTAIKILTTAAPNVLTMAFKAKWPIPVIAASLFGWFFLVWKKVRFKNVLKHPSDWALPDFYNGQATKTLYCISNRLTHFSYITIGVLGLIAIGEDRTSDTTATIFRAFNQPELIFMTAYLFSVRKVYGCCPKKATEPEAQVTENPARDIENQLEHQADASQPQSISSPERANRVAEMLQDTAGSPQPKMG